MSQEVIEEVGLTRILTHWNRELLNWAKPEYSEDSAGPCATMCYGNGLSLRGRLSSRSFHRGEFSASNTQNYL